MKAKPCAHCGSTFQPVRSMQAVCSAICAARKVKADKVQGRKTLRARKEAIKTIPTLIKEAQHAFNAYCRERDKDQACISCGRPLRNGGNCSTGGDFDCGHFRSTGSAPHLRFTEGNAAGQCKYCNRYLAGNGIGYRAGLIARVGLAAVEALEADNRIHKWTRDELIAIRATYKQKLKEMKANT